MLTFPERLVFFLFFSAGFLFFLPHPYQMRLLSLFLLVVYQLPGTSLIYLFYFGIQTSIKLSGYLHCELGGCVFVCSLCDCFISVCVCRWDVFSQLMCIRLPNQSDWYQTRYRSTPGLINKTPSQLNVPYFVCSASKGRVCFVKSQFSSKNDIFPKSETFVLLPASGKLQIFVFFFFIRMC